MKWKAFLLVLMLAAPFALADYHEVAQAPAGPSMTFRAALSGDQEVPVVATGGSGSANVRLQGNRLTLEGEFAGLSGAARAAHIHGSAARGTNAGVLFPLNFTADTRGTLSGTAELTDAQLEQLKAGLYYVNVHTPANPGGEVRGQLDEIEIRATLSGSQEVPAVNTAGRGTATVIIRGNRLTLTGSFSGLGEPARAAHIHGAGARGANAGVIIPIQFTAAPQGQISVEVELTPEQRAMILSGRTYVNIHTATHGGGEIRGQLDE
jgi:hypothetical protein